MCLFSSAHIPIVGESATLYKLRCGIGSVTCEQKVIPRLNPPGESHEDRTIVESKDERRDNSEQRARSLDRELFCRPVKPDE